MTAQFGVYHEPPSSPSGVMDGNGPLTSFREHRRERLDDYGLSLTSSKSTEDASSIDDNFSPRSTRKKGDVSLLRSSIGPSLPPLHPSLTASVQSQSQPFSSRCRTLSSDTMASTGSSVVSIDAGKHGFLTHDDASASGSLVLAYEQGKDIPPAEYDLPTTILGVFDASATLEEVERRQSVCYNIGSEEEFQKLPYQIRTRLTQSQTDKQELPLENRRYSNIPELNLPEFNPNYGAMEEGVMLHNNNNNYPSPGNGSTAANTMCYSTETSPLYNRGNPYMSNNHYPMPDQLQMPMKTAWMSSGEHLPDLEKRDAINTQTSVYFSMAMILVVFIGIIYGLFSFMKMIA